MSTIASLYHRWPTPGNVAPEKQYYNPPLIFNVESDPSEMFPLEHESVCTIINHYLTKICLRDFCIIFNNFITNVSICFDSFIFITSLSICCASQSSIHSFHQGSCIVWKKRRKRLKLVFSLVPLIPTLASNGHFAVVLAAKHHAAIAFATTYSSHSHPKQKSYQKPCTNRYFLMLNTPTLF